MKFLAKSLLLVVFFVSAVVAEEIVCPSEDITITMTTGSGDGVYYKIGNDIKTLVESKCSNITINVVLSNGSLLNMTRLLNKGQPPCQVGVQNEKTNKNCSADIGIVQSDVWKKNYDEYVRKAEVGFVLNLYKEEVHILAKKSIQNIQDLIGRTVVIGPKNSGTNFTAKNILEKLNVNYKEVVEYKKENCTENNTVYILPKDLPKAQEVLDCNTVNYTENNTVYVLSKEINKNTVVPVLCRKCKSSDALFFVAGKGVDVFAKNLYNYPYYKKYKKLENIVFVGFTKDERTRLSGSGYKSEDDITIVQEDYNWFHKTINTVAVEAFLITNKKKDQKHCQLINFIKEIIENNINNFFIENSEAGEKWKQTTFTSAVEIGLACQD
jgi:TRAP-type uncharacterized transport system substrate-binding protein